jgi:hypothetical protein
MAVGAALMIARMLASVAGLGARWR